MSLWFGKKKKKGGDKDDVATRSMRLIGMDLFFNNNLDATPAFRSLVFATHSGVN